MHALVNCNTRIELNQRWHSLKIVFCFSLVDVSEIRLKVSFETAPAERPHGILGVWSPLLSAIGNAFKFQVRCT